MRRGAHQAITHYHCRTGQTEMRGSPTVGLRLGTSSASETQETRADLHSRRGDGSPIPRCSANTMECSATMCFPVLSPEVIFRLNQQSWDLGGQRVQITQYSVSPRDYVLSVGIPGAGPPGQPVLSAPLESLSSSDTWKSPLPPVSLQFLPLCMCEHTKFSRHESDHQRISLNVHNHHVTWFRNYAMGNE